MPFTSGQISQNIGSQMAMFSNQAQYAGQVGAQMGFPNPNPMGGAMQSPMFTTPGYAGTENQGAAVAGGIGTALPAAAGGAALLGGMVGGPLGMLDPFTMAGRGFTMGSGAGMGAGFGGSTAHIGRMFATGGLRAGAGALAGGVGGAAAMAAIPLAIGAGVAEAGANVWQGAQDASQVRAMAGQYFGPQYGSASGFRPGGQMGPQQIRQITGVLGEIASQDTMLAMEDVKKLMDQFGRMGALTGVTNAEQFKGRFKELVKQTKTIAEVMGTSLDEAASLFSGMRQMGVWRAQDVMGTGVAAVAMGAGGQQAMFGAMQSGAQGSFARGGNLSAGAFLGRQNMMDINQAVRSGVLSDQDVMNLTGGVGGMEGQQMLAGQMTNSIQNMSQTAAGRLLMAGLGEFREGRYTGNIDEELMRQLRSGTMSIGQLQRLGSRNTRTRRGAASFTAQQDMMGQNLAASGGIEAMMGIRDVALQQAGLDSAGEDIQQLFTQKLFGMDARQTRFMERMFQNASSLRRGNRERIEQALEDRLRALDETRNRSFSGLGQAIGAWYERAIEEPLKNIGRDVERDVQDTFNSWNDWFMGRQYTDRYQTTRRQQNQILGAVQRGDINLTGMQDFGRDANLEAIEGSRFMGIDIDAIRTGESQLGVLGGLGMNTNRGTFSLFDLGGQSARGDLTTGSMFSGSIGVQRGTADRFLSRLRQEVASGADSLFDQAKLKEQGLSVSMLRRSFDESVNDTLVVDDTMARVNAADEGDKLKIITNRLQSTERGKMELKRIRDLTGAESDLEAVRRMGMGSSVGPLRSAAESQMSKLSSRVITNFRDPKAASEAMETAAGGMASVLQVDKDRLSEALNNQDYGVDLSIWIQRGAKKEEINRNPALRAAYQNDPNVQEIVDAAASSLGGVATRYDPDTQSYVSKKEMMIKHAGTFLQGKAFGVQAKTLEARQEMLSSGRDALSGMTGLSSTARAAIGGIGDVSTLGESSAAISSLVEAGMGLGAGDRGLLGRSGTAVGSLLARASGIQTIGAGSADRVMAQLNRAGFRGIGSMLEGDDQAQFERIFSDKQVTAVESRDLKRILKEFLETRGLREEEKAQTERVKDLTSALTKYTEENTKFVTAVGVALPQLKDVKVDDRPLMVATDEKGWF